METPIFVALSKQSGLLQELNTVANNLANVNTTGFRGSHRLFQEYLENTGTAGNRDRISFAQDIGEYYNLQQGKLHVTARSSDLAIEGEGYFKIGDVEGEYFTRKGSFQVNKDGLLVTEEGNPVLQANGASIKIPANHFFTIGEDGTVKSRNSDADGTKSVATEKVVGKVALVTFADQALLRQSGAGTYKTDQVPLPTKALIKQGMLESSNVDPILELTRMITLQRNFEMINKMVESEHSRQSSAHGRIGKTA